MATLATRLISCSSVGAAGRSTEATGHSLEFRSRPVRSTGRHLDAENKIFDFGHLDIGFCVCWKLSSWIRLAFQWTRRWEQPRRRPHVVMAAYCHIMNYSYNRNFITMWFYKRWRKRLRWKTLREDTPRCIRFRRRWRWASQFCSWSDRPHLWRKTKAKLQLKCSWSTSSNHVIWTSTDHKLLFFHFVSFSARCK